MTRNTVAAGLINGVELHPGPDAGHVGTAMNHRTDETQRRKLNKSQFSAVNNYDIAIWPEAVV